MNKQFCRDIDCKVREVLDKFNEDSLNYNYAKQFCKDCKAKQYEEWLDKQIDKQIHKE